MSAILKFIRENHILAIIDQTKVKKKSKLSLNSFDIVEIPSEISSCLEVKHLYLHKNRINAITVQITQLVNLTTLTLDYNNLSSLPPEIKNLINLVYLNVSNNPLKVLIPEIGDLENLEVLWCNGTGLNELPKEIGNLSKLDTLGARRNELRTLPEEINKLTKLRWLTLENNKIESLPNMEKMEFLVHCNLRRNNLTELPDSLLKCADLMFLLLNNNQITKMPEDFDVNQLDMNQPSLLEMIDLRENPICDMPHPEHPLLRYMEESPTSEIEPALSDISQSGTNRGHVGQALAVNAIALRMPAAPAVRHPDPLFHDMDFDGSSVDDSDDWENSVVSSELDLQYLSEDENADFEGVGLVLPELSRYSTTAS